jgi:hypothetical protein
MGDNFSSLFNVNSIPHLETTEKLLEESLESYVPYPNPTVYCLNNNIP